MCIAIPVAAKQNTKPKNLGLVMGICSVWISVGQIIAFNSLPLILGFTNWGGASYIYILFTVIAMGIFSYKFLPKKESEKATNQSQEKLSVWHAMKNIKLIFAAFGFLVYNFCLMVVVTFFPSYATSQGTLTLSQATLIASLPMVFCLFGSPLFGKLADRFGHKWLYATCVLCGGVGSALMFTKSLPVVIIGTIVLGFVGAATPSLMFSSIIKLVKTPSLLAQSNAVAVLFQNAGLFLASFLFGNIVSISNGNFTIAAIISLVPLGIISAILAISIRYADKPTN